MSRARPWGHSVSCWELRAQPIATGAHWSDVGIGVGALVGPKLQAASSAELVLPGGPLCLQRHFLALPAVQENGDLGAALGPLSPDSEFRPEY